MYLKLRSLHSYVELCPRHRCENPYPISTLKFKMSNSKHLPNIFLFFALYLVNGSPKYPSVQAKNLSTIFKSNFKFIGELRVRYKDFLYSLLLAQPFSLLIAPPGRYIYYNRWTYYDTILSPKVRSLHYSVGLDKCIMTDIHHYSSIQNIFSLSTIINSFFTAPIWSITLIFIVYNTKLSKLPVSQCKLLWNYVYFYSIKLETDIINSIMKIKCTLKEEALIIKSY